MPRPTKLTPDTQQRIVDALRLGATYELAAQYGGIAYNTFNDWRKRFDSDPSACSIRRLANGINTSHG